MRSAHDIRIPQPVIGAGHRIAIQRSCAGLLLAALLLTTEAWSDKAAWVGHGLALAGWILIGIGMAGRLWSTAFVAGRKTGTLVTDGPYSMTRNPLYFFSMVGGTGAMLVTETMTLPLLFVVAFLAGYHRVIAREEMTLQAVHGAAFEAYVRRVPRFWPRLALYSERGECVVCARLLRRALSDSVCWVAAGGLIEFVKAMHAFDYLPAMVKLY